jgi:hypothetical protein
MDMQNRVVTFHGLCSFLYQMKSKPRNPLDQAAERRDLAKRARRLAQELAPGAERKRLLKYAEELEEQAARLEADASEPARLPIVPIPQVQTQVQQQQEGSPEVNGSTPATPKV